MTLTRSDKAYRLQCTAFVDGLRVAYRPGTIDERVLSEGLATVNLDGDRSWLRSDSVVLDVGAHIGALTLRAAIRAPHGRVFAVEAGRESYELLVRNIRLNGLSNVCADHLALSDRPGNVRLHHDSESWGHTITKPIGAEGEDVPAVTLAQYLDDRAIERCDAAKLNCEGAEFPILMGASTADLQRIERMVVFYHLDLVDERFSLEALEGHLAESGFDLRHRSVWPQRGHIIATRQREAG